MTVHPTLRRLMTTCGLKEDEELRRRGAFLVAHTVMDTHLISVLVDEGLGKIGGVGVVSIERQQETAAEIARTTFKDHLTHAKPFIPAQAIAIAEEVDRGRDAFVHWKRGRWELPRYRGRQITEEQGFQECMAAVGEFLLAVPFRNPAWTANP